MRAGVGGFDKESVWYTWITQRWPGRADRDILRRKRDILRARVRPLGFGLII